VPGVAGSNKVEGEDFEFCDFLKTYLPLFQTFFIHFSIFSTEKIRISEVFKLLKFELVRFEPFDYTDFIFQTLKQSPNISFPSLFINQFYCFIFRHLVCEHLLQISRI